MAHPSTSLTSLQRKDASRGYSYQERLILLPIDTREVDKNVQIFIDKKLPQAVADAMELACLKVEEAAKEGCPVGDGTLRQSITHEVETTKRHCLGVIGSNLVYAPYVHQGTGIYALEGNGRKDVPWTYYDVKSGEFRSTKGIQATPFLQQAIDSNRKEIINYLEGILKE